MLIEGDGSLAHDLRHLIGRDSVGAAGSVAAVGAHGAADVVGSGAAQPGVVVLVADIALDPRRGDLWLRRGVPHLPVVTTGSRAVVGPLVDSATGSPCLWCLDLHRSDRDAAWPTVMAQVATVPVDSGAAQTGPSPVARPGAHPVEPGLSQLVAGTVAALVARSSAGSSPPPGVAVEVSLPWPRIDHRWRCSRAIAAGCRAPDVTAAGRWPRSTRRGHRLSAGAPQNVGSQMAPYVDRGGAVTDLPRKAVVRSAKLASVPLGFAGRTALGFGKRIGGKPAEVVAAELQARTAQQLFQVLGELKGGAMKFGQALSIFEAAFPEEIAVPYRATLTKLQDSAPPMPTSSVHEVLRADLGARWRSRFQLFDDQPVASASIGQVHRGRVGRRPRRRGQDPVPRRRRGPAWATSRQISPGRPRSPPAGSRARASARSSTSCATGWPRSSTTASRRESQATFADAFDGRRGLRHPGTSWRTPSTSSSRSGSRASRCRRSSPTARPRSATTPRSCYLEFLLAGPAGPGCCTPTRTPATSG